MAYTLAPFVCEYRSGHVCTSLYENLIYSSYIFFPFVPIIFYLSRTSKPAKLYFFHSAWETLLMFSSHIMIKRLPWPTADIPSDSDTPATPKTQPPRNPDPFPEELEPEHQPEPEPTVTEVAPVDPARLDASKERGESSLRVNWRQHAPHPSISIASIGRINSESITNCFFCQTTSLLGPTTEH